MNRLRHFFSILIPADMVVIGFLTALTALILVLNYKVPSPGSYVIKHAIIIGVYILLLELYNRYKKEWLAIPRYFYPVFLFPVIYRGLDPLINIIIPHELDQFFINVDYAIFGSHPSLWLERIVNPWLTEILQISYTTYYYFPTFLGIWLYVRKQREEYVNVLLAITLTMFGSFLIFLLVPVFGPRFFMGDLFTVPLEGKFFAPIIADFVGRNGLRGGAFPSAHSAVAFMTLILSFRYFRTFFYIALPVMLCLFFSTIYCRYHYVIDVLGGLVLGGLSAYLAPKWNERWFQKRTQRAAPSS